MMRKHFSQITRKEGDRLFGQLVIDFVNGSNPDETFDNLFLGLQEAFELSSDFVIKFRRRFPPFKDIQGFLPLNRTERNLFEELNKRIRVREAARSNEDR